jgi:hypothetical protein
VYLLTAEREGHRRRYFEPMPDVRLLYHAFLVDALRRDTDPDDYTLSFEENVGPNVWQDAPPEYVGQLSDEAKAACLESARRVLSGEESAKTDQGPPPPRKSYPVTRT